MTEKINEYKETDKEEEKAKKPGFELPQVHAENLAKELSSVANLVSHDQSINEKDLENLDAAIHGMKVEEIEKIPDLEKNMKIWEEMRNGKFDNMYCLTYVSEEMAREFTEKMNYHSVNFTRVKNLSDEAIKYLVGDKHLLLGITSISDQAAQYLGEHKSRLELNRLIELSDKAAEQISKIPDSVYMNGLENISDSAAEKLGKHVGELILDGITSLSGKAALYLSQNQGELRFCRLTSLSDEAAEGLSHHQGSLCLQRLNTLSDKGAEFLAADNLDVFQFSYGIKDSKIKEMILKYKKK